MCPYCSYSFNSPNREYCYGDFWKLPVELEREKSKIPLYGCPKCKKVFIYDKKKSIDEKIKILKQKYS